MGYVEIITLPDSRQMLINADGRIMGMPLNMEASDIAQRHIVGNVVILDGMRNGNNKEDKMIGIDDRVLSEGFRVVSKILV